MFSIINWDLFCLSLQLMEESVYYTREKGLRGDGKAKDKVYFI